MSLRKLPIFSDPTCAFTAGVNLYRDRLAASAGTGLPVLCGPELQGKQGNWRAFVQQSNPHFVPETSKLVLEIGCHTGLVLQRLATDLPHWQFVGIDLTFKRAVKTAEKAVSAQLHNMMSILGNAEQLPTLFSPGELDGVLAFFPDPWNKKRYQLKNRLFSREFCCTLAALLREGGFFWLKTDDGGYHAEISTYLVAAGLCSTPVRSEFSERERYFSTFEKQFMGKKVQTYESFWVKAMPM